MYIPFDRSQQDLSGSFLFSLYFFGFDEGLQMRHGLFHHAGRLDHLRQEHLSGAKEIANDIHTVH